MKINFTKEQEGRLRDMYKPDDPSTVDLLMVELDKSRSSIVGKLSSMGIYRKKDRVDKAGNDIVPKADLVTAIRIFSGARDNELASLEKASKQDLRCLIEVFKRLNNQFDTKN